MKLFACTVLSGVFLSAALIYGCISVPGTGPICAVTGTSVGGATVSYSLQIAPILTDARCATSSCHGGTFQSSNYDQRTYASSFVPGDDAKKIGACPIVPGHPENSFFLEKLKTNPRIGLQMPLEREPLTDAQIALIEQWILEGAQDN